MSIKLYDKSGSTPQEVLLAGISPVDQILNGTSKNAISNKAVYNALAEKIEVTVENLTNFYNKSQTYNKTEVRALVDAISTMTIEVVNSLPTQDISTTTIYFLKQSGTNVYDQYVYVNNAWVKIGDTQIDLSGYMTTADFNIAIADYYDKSAIDTMIANYYTKAQVDDLLQNIEIDVDSTLSDSSENPVQNKVIKGALDDKQNLIFEGTTAQWNAVSDKSKYSLVVITDDADYVGNIVDSVTDGNMSAVTSNAVYDYPIDSVTDGQHRPPTSNAVYDLLKWKTTDSFATALDNAVLNDFNIYINYSISSILHSSCFNIARVSSSMNTRLVGGGASSSSSCVYCQVDVDWTNKTLTPAVFYNGSSVTVSSIAIIYR